jgi:hypothetical protein
MKRCSSEKAMCFEQGIMITDIPLLTADSAILSLRHFMQRDVAYRCRFLQKSYGYGFDGYSHYGQADSTHQAADDMLHSFVFSDFYPVERYPQEFQGYINAHWPALTRTLRDIELAILDRLSIKGGVSQYRAHMGHMMSANYFPPPGDFLRPSQGNSRLSEHPDVSLFTVFPFGIDRDFEYQDEQDRWHKVPSVDTMLIFPGYLMEWMSGGAIKALNHRVSLNGESDRERFSFAVFSLPYPVTTLYREIGQEVQSISAEAYFRDYLSLWDY